MDQSESLIKQPQRPAGSIAPVVRVIGCGMIAREILAVCEQNGLHHIDLKCLPAVWHHHPDKIAPGVEQAILDARAEGIADIFVAYGDCGTGGRLDDVCRRHGVERIGGPHCFSFYTGNAVFAQAGEDWLTTFFITDFLARHFDTFLVKPLGLDRHPELRDMYFGHYTRALYLAQTDDAALERKAQAGAARLGLAYERRWTGYGDLAAALQGLG